MGKESFRLVLDTPMGFVVGHRVRHKEAVDYLRVAPNALRVIFDPEEKEK